MVPADSHRVSRAPRYLGATQKEECIFRYGAVTLFGRPSHAVFVTLSYNLVRIRTASEFLQRQHLFFVVLQPRALLANCTV